MAEEELDVKSTEESSSEETSDESEISEEIEDEKQETDVKEEDSEAEKPETSEESEEKAETESTEAEDLKTKLAKAEEEKENLKKALQEARQKPKPSLAQAAKSVPEDEKLTIDPNEYVRNLVLQAEEEAKAILYQEFPELHPDNDPDNSVYNEFSKEFAIAAKLKGITPVSKDNFLQIGRLVMGLKTGRQPQQSVKKQASTDAHKEAAKGSAASIGGTSVASKPEKQLVATDADRRAAKAANMPLDKYLKNKDVYDDGIPV